MCENPDSPNKLLAYWKEYTAEVKHKYATGFINLAILSKPSYTTPHGSGGL